MSETKTVSKRPMRHMGPGPGHMMGGEKAKNFKGTMKKLFRYLKPYWFSFTMVIIFAVASTVFSIMSPKILGNITTQVVNDYIKIMVYDQVMDHLPDGVTLPAGTTGQQIYDMMAQNPQTKATADQMTQKMTDQQMKEFKSMTFDQRPSIDFDKIMRIALFLIGLYLISSLFSYIQGYIVTGVSQKITYHFRKSISEKTNRMPLKYFDSKTHGEVLSRVTNDVDTVSQTLNQSLSQMISSVVMIVGILVMMFSISWQLTLLALAILPISMGFITFVVKRSQKFFKTQQATLGEINGHVEEMYSGHHVMKAFNGERRSVEQFQELNKKLYGSAWKSQFFSGLMQPIMGFIGNLGYVGICMLGGWLAIKGKINVGDIQAFIQYVRQFNQPIAQTAQIANVLQSTAAAAERVFEYLDEEEETPESSHPVHLDKVSGQVEFENVVFGYSPDKTIIKSFSATIKPGQRVAIVGPTGAGKTTMVNLLMRFYDVNSGSIKVDGMDIRDMSRKDLRGLFGMVLQDTWLFNGTIRDNIAYSNLKAPDSEVFAAAEAAHVDHFIHSLPHGYFMELNEEADNISQGQKQLLTIARAMFEDAPMLILDEATSSVDTRTEVLIQKAMERLMAGRTSFVIAHRLSTIRDADLILVMRDGNIVEQGTHDQLMQQKGFYCDLYNSQFEVSA